MSKEPIQKAFDLGKDRYAEIGVNADEAMDTLSQNSISIHCWQADDVGGFEKPDAELSGGDQGVPVHGALRHAAQLRRAVDDGRAHYPVQSVFRTLVRVLQSEERPGEDPVLADRRVRDLL